MNNKKKALQDQQESNQKRLNILALPGIGELFHDIDFITRPIIIEIVLLITIKRIAEQNDLTLSEQLKIWRPFDV